MSALARNLATQAVALLLLAACTTLIGSYSAEAYKNATELKARSLVLVAQSNDAFPQHEAAVENLMTDVTAAYGLISLLVSSAFGVVGP